MKKGDELEVFMAGSTGRQMTAKDCKHEQKYPSKLREVDYCPTCGHFVENGDVWPTTEVHQ